jgi:hypothetical protein
LLLDLAAMLPRAATAGLNAKPQCAQIVGRRAPCASALRASYRSAGDGARVTGAGACHRRDRFPRMMAGLADRPLLFPDVDGLLIPFRARTAGPSLAADVVGPAGDVARLLDDASGKSAVGPTQPGGRAACWLWDASWCGRPRGWLTRTKSSRLGSGNPSRARARLALEDGFPTCWAAGARIRLARRRND